MDDITTLTIDKLRLSPFNCRINEADAINTVSMEASLLAQGQLEPILCHPLRGSNGTFGVHAGGRRYRSFKALIGRSDLPTDFAIKVIVRTKMTDLELAEESLAENLIRKDLRDYEIYAAVRRLHNMGLTPLQIAERYGQELHWAEGCLRLGDLAEPVFAAYAAGRISRDQALAFGATGDRALQLAVWQQLAPDGSLRHEASRIRSAMKVGDVQLGRLLKLVGEVDYLRAGGRIEPDLFDTSDDPRSRISDEPLLRNLAEEILAGERSAVRQRFARPDLKFEPEPPRGEYQAVDHKLQITPGREGGRDTLPDGSIFARLYVDEHGQPVTDFWWASRAAKAAGARAPLTGSQLLKKMTDRPTAATEKAMDLRPAAALGQQYDNARQLADAAIREEEGLSADSVNIFRSQRRQILRAMLVEDGDRAGSIGQDWLVWTQLRLVLDPDARPTKLGVGGSSCAEANPSIADEHVGAMPATARWKAALAEVSRQSFVTTEDEAEALSDFVASDDRMKRLAAAVAAGFALQRSLAADGYVVPVHDRLARHLGIQPGWHDEEVRRHWVPTEALLARIPTRQALAIAEPFIQPEPFGAWMKAKAADVTRRLAQLVTGHAVPGQRTDRAGAAATWVHHLLRFLPDPGLPDNDDTPPPAAAAKEVA